MVHCLLKNFNRLLDQITLDHQISQLTIIKESYFIAQSHVIIVPVHLR